MLQFSDTTNKNGIIQRIEFDTNLGDTGISGNATLLSQFTAVINGSYAKATDIIMSASGTWTWDDSSQTNQAVATTDIVSGQGDYSILRNTPSSDQDWLKPERVEIKDADGNWIRLRGKNLRRKQRSITEERLTEGTPSYFDFNGTSIFFDAIPNYASTEGIQIWFSRAALQFASSDTTKRPGFASIFHEYLVLCSVYHWEKYKGVGNPEQTKRDIVEMERKMGDFYSGRDATEPNVLRRAKRSYR